MTTQHKYFRPEHSLDCGSMFQREPCPACEQREAEHEHDFTEQDCNGRWMCVCGQFERGN